MTKSNKKFSVKNNSRKTKYEEPSEVNYPLLKRRGLHREEQEQLVD